MYKKIVILSLVYFVTACSTVQTAKDSQGSGAKRDFSQPKSVVWPAMISAVNTTGGEIKEKSENECYILASYGMTAWSWGEKVAIFCKPKNEKTEVEVVMKAAYKANVTAVDRAPKIFSEIEQTLSQ